MSNEPNILRPFVILFLISCALNLCALFATHPLTRPEMLDADPREYYDLSGQVVDGSYQFYSRRVPGHFLILAAFRTFTGSNLVSLQVLVTTLFSLTAPFAYLLARRFVSGERVAMIAGLATAAWPLFVIYGRTLYSETTALPLFLFFLASLPRGACLGQTRTVPGWRWIVSGALIAVCMLVRPMYLIFLPLIPVILWIEEGRLRKLIRPMILMAVGCLLTLSPWSIYASLHVGRPLLLSENGGETLAGGLNPMIIQRGYQKFAAPDGRVTWSGPGNWVDGSNTGYLSKADFQLSRTDRDYLLLKRAILWIEDHPGQAFYLEGTKLTYMWGIYPFWNGLQQTLLGNVPTLLLLLLSLLSVIRFRQHWRQLFMLYTLPLFVSAVALVSWGSWRFRQPADVGLILLGVFFLCARLGLSRFRFRAS